MARSMTSLGIDSALALATASLRREFIAGSAMPDLAATVISRDSLENALERAASARPLRCWMFLNFECPAMALRSIKEEVGRGSTFAARWAEPPAVASWPREPWPQARVSALEASGGGETSMSEHYDEFDDILPPEPNGELVHWMEPRRLTLGTAG